MKKTFICLTAAALVVGLNFRASTSSSQPPTGATGAPGETTCASSGCHSGNLNTGTGSVALVNPPTDYVPGQTYQLQIRVTDATKSRFGFELVALNANNNQAGSFSLINTANTAMQTAGLKIYMSHKAASLNNTWTFNWTAPVNNAGPVTFFMAGNAANGNGNTTGDFVYTSSYTVAQAPTGLKEDAGIGVKIYPNPASSNLNLELPEINGSLKVLDLTGREIFRQESNTLPSQIDVSKFPNGTYFIQADQAKTKVLKRFVVQH